MFRVGFAGAGCPEKLPLDLWNVQGQAGQGLEPPGTVAVALLMAGGGTGCPSRSRPTQTIL